MPSHKFNVADIVTFRRSISRKAPGGVFAAASLNIARAPSLLAYADTPYICEKSMSSSAIVSRTSVRFRGQCPVRLIGVARGRQ
jgi:hypothetical protein